MALVLANARYWTSVAPIVRRELARWERHARAIEDPELRVLALSKLRCEGFHAEAAAMLATLAPRAHRSTVVQAIVALELLFDYLDGLTERPSDNPLVEGERLFKAFIDAAAAGSARPENDLRPPEIPLGYLESLSRAATGAVAQLPAAFAIADVARRTAERSAQAQTRMHAAPALGATQLETWANAEANGSGLGWRELAAGAASSVLVLHALIAAAADPRTTPGQAGRIEAAYLSMCVVLTLLDGLVDHEQDTSRGGGARHGYLGLYGDPTELSDVLGQAARRAALEARALPGGARDVMILVGVVAYYGSAPGAEGELARPVVARLRRELAPLASPTLAIMRAWRSIRRRTRSPGVKGEGES
jgi:tetraprenyl-beta-curcumene synthase